MEAYPVAPTRPRRRRFVVRRRVMRSFVRMAVVGATVALASEVYAAPPSKGAEGVVWWDPATWHGADDEEDTPAPSATASSAPIQEEPPRSPSSVAAANARGMAGAHGGRGPRARRRRVGEVSCAARGGLPLRSARARWEGAARVRDRLRGGARRRHRGLSSDTRGIGSAGAGCASSAPSMSRIERARRPMTSVPARGPSIPARGEGCARCCANEARS
jgi:hypothetical protein